MVDIWKRGICPSCGKSRSVYCADCVVPIPCGVDIPVIDDLAFKFYVVRSPHEKKSKSSAIPTKIIAPNFVFLHYYPDIPEDLSAEDTLILAADPDATSPDEIPDWSVIKKVVAVDCTWSQTHRILNDPKMREIPKLRLNGGKTQFWRYQDFGPDHLATVEAMCAVAEVTNGKEVATKLRFYYDLKLNRVLADCPELADIKTHPTKLKRDYLKIKNREREKNKKVGRSTKLSTR